MIKKVLVLLIALVLFVPGNVFAANGKPFEELQQQIDQLKTQLQNIQLTPGPAGPAGEGAIKVYDANDQFLGIFAGLTPGGVSIAPGIFNPVLKLFFQIVLDPQSLEYGQIPKGGYNPSSAGTIYISRRDTLIHACNDDKYFTGTGEAKVTAVNTLAGCSTMGGMPLKVFETREVLISEFPFTLPIAMPLRYE